MKTLFVVMFSSGEYSDRSEYALCATEDEGVAQACVERLETLFRAVKAKFTSYKEPEWSVYWAARQAAVEILKPHAPHEEYLSVDDDSRAWLKQLTVVSAIPEFATELPDSASGDAK